MGIFDKLFKRKTDEDKKDDGTLTENALVEKIVFSDEEYRYSQSIYDRNLRDVYIFELQPEAVEPGANKDMQTGLDTQELAAAPFDLVQGQFIGITDGLLTLGVMARRCFQPHFAPGGVLLMSYSKFGESFFIKAKIFEAKISKENPAKIFETENADNTIDNEQKTERYTVSLVLFTESGRHHREHGRISVAWKILYKNKDAESNYYEATTVDISPGGFKGTVDRITEKESIIECIIEIDEENKSEGKLTGRVVRCYRIPGVRDVYEMTVQFIEMDSNDKEFLQKQISKEQPAAVNTEAKIEISSDGEQAIIELNPPKNNGEDLTYDRLCALISEENIKHGIDYDLIKTISEKPHYNLKYVIAKCTPPVHGTDAQLTYKVEMNPTFTPKIDEEGMADFKDIGLIHRVNKNEVLAVKVLSTVGEHGISVTGETINAVPGVDIPLPAGQNTIVNDLGTALLAAVDGYVSIVNGTINIFDTYTVEGDVQYTTGNIDHNGIVIIKGDVRSGFTVRASGDIVVNGTIESANIIAGGALVVHGGCVGEESNVDIKGNVAIRFIDGGEFSIAGTLISSYIINAVVKCGETVELAGPGFLRNSHVIAKTAINAKSVGSISAGGDRTIVEVGNDPITLNKFETLTADLEKIEKDLEKVRTNIQTLTVRKFKEELSKESLRVLEHSKLASMQLTVQRKKMLATHELLKEHIEMLGYGTINVEDTAYEGLRVIIGPREFVLRDTVKGARFVRTNKGIEIEGL